MCNMGLGSYEMSRYHFQLNLVVTACVNFYDFVLILLSFSQFLKLLLQHYSENLIKTKLLPHTIFRTFFVYNSIQNMLY